MLKKLLLALLVLVLVVVIAVALLWYFMGKPLYEPGMVRAAQNLSAPLVPPAQTGDESFWLVENGIRLYHFSEGAGPNVLVIHGGPGVPIHKPLAGLQPLANRHRFVYYDQRGCGKSTRPFDRFTSQNYLGNLKTLERTLGLGAQIADIERIRRLFGDPKIVLVGHSFGGFLASLYAAEFPENVKALVLVAPADVLVMPQANGGLFEQVKGRLPESMKKEYGDFQRRYLDFGHIFSNSEADLAALDEGFVKYYRAAAGPASLPAESETEAGQDGGWMVFAMYFSMGSRHDYRAALQKVKVPVLVIHGANDLQPEGASRAYAEAFSNSRFEVVKNSGHFPFWEQPQDFAAVVGKFLAEVE